MSGWRAGQPQEAGGWALVHLRQAFLGDANGVLFPRDWLRRQELPVLSEHPLGWFDGQAVYLFELEQPAEMPGCAWQGLRQFMLNGDAETFRMLGYATQVGTWVRQHRFCGSCGGRMQMASGERAMHCPLCEVQHYPRLSPSMIVLISRGDELLLARSQRFPPGMYSTLAGFVEPGESVEECVHREIREEVGLQVRDLQYVGSQGWPFPHSLMLGFHASYDSGDIVPEPGEIEDARWFAIDALPSLPPPRSISRHLIELYLARRSGRPAPVLPG